MYARETPGSVIERFLNPPREKSYIHSIATASELGLSKASKLLGCGLLHPRQRMHVDVERDGGFLVANRSAKTLSGMPCSSMSVAAVCRNPWLGVMPYSDIICANVILMTFISRLWPSSRVRCKYKIALVSISSISPGRALVNPLEAYRAFQTSQRHFFCLCGAK